MYIKFAPLRSKIGQRPAYSVDWQQLFEDMKAAATERVHAAHTMAHAVKQLRKNMMSYSASLDELLHRELTEDILVRALALKLKVGGGMAFLQALPMRLMLLLYCNDDYLLQVSGVC